MNDFMNLIQNESIATIEGLTGRKPDIKHAEIASRDKINLQTPFALILIENASGAKLAFVAPHDLTTILSDLMLGGEGAVNAEITNDDLDAIKEIVSNIFGAVSTTLKGQKILPIMDFKIANASILNASENLDDFNFGCTFSFDMDKIHSNFILLISPEIRNELEKKPNY